MIIEMYLCICIFVYYCIAGLDTLTWRDPCRFPESPSAPRKWTARYHIWNTSFIASEDDDQNGEVDDDGGGDHDGEVDHDDDYLVRVPPLPEPRLASR